LIDSSEALVEWRLDQKFAALDVARIVVTLLHLLQELLATQLDFVVLESWRGQNLAQDLQAFVEILGKQVNADFALGVADA
jgi:hypothetical protein